MAVTRRARPQDVCRDRRRRARRHRVAYGFAYARHQLEITRADVPVAGLPAALAGLRIGLMTDIHRSRWVSHEDVATRSPR